METLIATRSSLPQMESAYARGCADQAAGRTVNPYPRGTADEADWARGYRAQAHVSRHASAWNKSQERKG